MNCQKQTFCDINITLKEVMKVEHFVQLKRHISYLFTGNLSSLLATRYSLYLAILFVKKKTQLTSSFKNVKTKDEVKKECQAGWEPQQPASPTTLHPNVAACWNTNNLCCFSHLWITVLGRKKNIFFVCLCKILQFPSSYITTTGWGIKHNETQVLRWEKM